MEMVLHRRAHHNDLDQKASLVQGGGVREERERQWKKEGD